MGASTPTLSYNSPPMSVRSPIVFISVCAVSDRCDLGLCGLRSFLSRSVRSLIVVISVCAVSDRFDLGLCGLRSGLDLSFAGSQGEYHCMWRCPRPGLNPSGLVNNSSLAAGPQFTEMKIL